MHHKIFIVGGFESHLLSLKYRFKSGKGIIIPSTGSSPAKDLLIMSTGSSPAKGVRGPPIFIKHRFKSGNMVFKHRFKSGNT